jgi:hypothetical protein
MIINGKEYGFAYDNGAIIDLCEILGLEYVHELQDAYNKAFQPLIENPDKPKISIAFLKITYALILVCANRWADRNGKSYRMTNNDLYDESQDTIGAALKEVYGVLFKAQPTGKSESKEGEVKKK